MTRKKFIVKVFETMPNSACDMSCVSICKAILAMYVVSNPKYLSGSVSSLLRKMVHDKILMYSQNTAIRGGYMYMLYDENKLWYTHCEKCKSPVRYSKQWCTGCGTLQTIGTNKKFTHPVTNA